MGTDYTASSVTDGAWQTYASGARTTDQTSTWMTTAYSTFEITGVQLEVGSVATDFEHRSFGQELALCQRYYFNVKGDDDKHVAIGFAAGTGFCLFNFYFPVPMRAAPTYTGSATAARFYTADQSAVSYTHLTLPTSDLV